MREASNRIRFLAPFAALAAMLVMAVGAQAASAAEGPFYKVAGSRLLSGSTAAIGATKAATEQVLAVPSIGVQIKCSEVKASGKLVGSSGANAGESEETLTYTGCSVSGDGEQCTVAEPITTETLINQLAYQTSSRTGKVLVLFKPKAGSKFVTIHFEGSCTYGSSTEVTGSTFCEAWSGGKAVEVGANEKETVTGEVNCPASTQEGYVEKSGSLTKSSAKLVAFFFEATYTGRTSIELASKAPWGAFT